MRIVVAALIGGLVMFAWGMFVHVVVPVGELGMKAPGNGDAVLAAMRDGFPDSGVYALPHFGGDRSDPAAVAAYARKSSGEPYAFVVYQAQGHDLTAMGPQLGTQWVTDTLSALILAFALSAAGPGFLRRVALAGGFALFVWLSLSVPYWNWYRFPFDFTAGQLIEQLGGWLLAGAAMAGWLGRRGR